MECGRHETIHQQDRSEGKRMYGTILLVFIGIALVLAAMAINLFPKRK